jgi:DNA-binding SARP family transcriptional activator
VPLHLRLLGGFRVDRGGVEVADSAWQQRRAAKRLIKVLATNARHALHREQILETLWGHADVGSALNSLGKALHAARRALEPDLPPRSPSTYVRVSDGVVILDTQHVLIDADQFQYLAEAALRLGSVEAYERALAVYGGELLPEDRYEDWSAERREYLAQMNIRLLIGLANALRKQGAYVQAADRLRAVLHLEPTREDVHRRLMGVYAEMGTPLEAIRQFQVCRDVLRRELDVPPEIETEALYHEILNSRFQPSVPPRRVDARLVAERPAPAIEATPATPFVGRNRMLRFMREQLIRAEGRKGGILLFSGEAGVGKTRLVAEFAADARRHGALVLSGASEAYPSGLLYGPFAVALERYVASCAGAERYDLARRYPALADVVPSIEVPIGLSPLANFQKGDYVPPSVARLLTDLAAKQPIVVVLGDLHDVHPSAIDLLEYLAHLAGQRRWLLIGTFRREAMPAGSTLDRLVEATRRDGCGLQIELEGLARAECDELVRMLAPSRELDEAAMERVYALSVGNPLFATELARELSEYAEHSSAGANPESPDGAPHVPTRVRALVRMMLGAFVAGGSRVLTLAAAAGMRMTLDDLRASAAALEPPIPDSVLMTALDQALHMRILDEHGDGYEFRHPLVRAALCEDLPSHRWVEIRAALGRVANAKLGGGERQPAVVGVGMQEGDAELRAGGAAVAIAGPMAETYGALVDRLDGSGFQRESTEARESLAMALIAKGSYERALHVLREAEAAYAEMADSDGLRRLATQIELVGRLLADRGDGDALPGLPGPGG